MIKKYQSVMLIEVIMTIKMWARLPLKVERFDRMEAILSPLPALRQKTLWNCREVIFYQIYRIYTVIPIYLYCLINIDQMYVIVIKLLFL